MSNTRRIDLVKLRRALARGMALPSARHQPDRRVRACCGSRQGFPHFAGCAKLAPAMPGGEMTVKL